MTALTQSPAWRALEAHAKEMRDTHLRDLFADRDRFVNMSIDDRDLGILLDYSKNRVRATTMDLLLELVRDEGGTLLYVTHSRELADLADRLGLAQLYQLRGRVGRSSQRAYAYLFHPEEQTLSEDAYRRLEAIGEFSDLGSGFELAMRDLEIRGAGELLGEEIDTLGARLCERYRDARPLPP